MIQVNTFVVIYPRSRDSEPIRLHQKFFNIYLINSTTFIKLVSLKDQSINLFKTFQKFTILEQPAFFLTSLFDDDLLELSGF